MLDNCIVVMYIVLYNSWYYLQAFSIETDTSGMNYDYFVPCRLSIF